MTAAEERIEVERKNTFGGGVFQSPSLFTLEGLPGEEIWHGMEQHHFCVSEIGLKKITMPKLEISKP